MSRALTHDEELFAALGHPHLAGEDPERIRRISTELATGFEALVGVTRAVSIFGSTRATPASHEYQLAREVAAALGHEGFDIITGGGPGLMEAANLGARDAGARSIGLTIELPTRQPTNPYLDLTVHFRHFFARKLMFVRYASAFVVMPGGFGTLDELFEALTLISTRTITSFPVVLVGESYWRGLFDWLLASLLTPGRVDLDDLELLHVTDDPQEVCRIIDRAHAVQAAPAVRGPARRG